MDDRTIIYSINDQYISLKINYNDDGICDSTTSDVLLSDNGVSYKVVHTFDFPILRFKKSGRYVFCIGLFGRIHYSSDGINWRNISDIGGHNILDIIYHKGRILASFNKGLYEYSKYNKWFKINTTNTVDLCGIFNNEKQPLEFEYLDSVGSILISRYKWLTIISHDCGSTWEIMSKNKEE